MRAIYIIGHLKNTIRACLKGTMKIDRFDDGKAILAPSATVAISQQPITYGNKAAISAN